MVVTSFTCILILKINISKEVLKMGCLYSLDWTTRLDYWTDIFASKNHFYAL